MLTSRADLAIAESVRLIQDLARKRTSSALARLAAKMASNMHGAGQFDKIEGLIRDMISKLEAEADADASRKSWCDRNLADASRQKSGKTAEVAKLTSRIDVIPARSAQLQSEVAALQDELANLAKSPDLDTALMIISGYDKELIMTDDLGQSLPIMSIV